MNPSILGTTIYGNPQLGLSCVDFQKWQPFHAEPAADPNRQRSPHAQHVFFDICAINHHHHQQQQQHNNNNNNNNNNNHFDILWGL